MISKCKSGGFQAHCDNCPNAIQISFATDFKHATQIMKESGWLNRKIDDDWLNFCSNECYKDAKENF